MIPRTDFIAGKVCHRAYYGQFITTELCSMVVNWFGIRPLAESTDESFNDIHLSEWDNLAYDLPGATISAMLDAAGGISLAAKVCVLKRAARHVVELEREHGLDSWRALGVI